MNKICIVCNNQSPFRLKKNGVDYFQCVSCKTLFSEPIDNSNLVGGGFEEERNINENAGRIERILKICGNDLTGINVLDFGCGHGMLVKDLKEAGFNAEGYDAYNPEYNKFPEREKYHICSIVEVIEHLQHPFVELDCIYRSLVNTGIVYLESSFVDVAIQENIPLEEFHYVSPEAGHNTIFSHHSLDLIFALKGFTPHVHLNRHVRVYQKLLK